MLKFYRTINLANTSSTSGLSSGRGDKPLYQPRLTLYELSIKKETQMVL